MKYALFSLLVFASVTVSGQNATSPQEVSQILSTYFGKTASSSALANKSQALEASRTFSIRRDSLFIYLYDPMDVFTKAPFYDTTIIPIHQIQQIKIHKSRNSAGQVGVGIEFIQKNFAGNPMKEKSTDNGAPAKISDKNLASVNAASVNQKMIGQVAGVTVGNDNSPGGATMVRIRGYGSINSNSPLYVVDDVPVTGNLNTINPNDIESVQVLKDASLTAIYGVRGANGVVLIKTKKGGISSGIPADLPRDLVLSYTLWTWGKAANEFNKSDDKIKIKKFLEQDFN
ncbi:TonB-dependent receptor plug domain-containing protein [Aquirufa nivalisilvae]|uniref:TonB-dependent receptor plug domain-containing protein n=1 Tax=Aquirufa nivalisilvae TaxID=2516557 RepID=UPI00267933A4